MFDDPINTRKLTLMQRKIALQQSVFNFLQILCALISLFIFLQMLCTLTYEFNCMQLFYHRFEGSLKLYVACIILLCRNFML